MPLSLLGCTVVAVSATALVSVLTDDDRCLLGELKYRHSCLSLLKTSRIVHCLTLTDGVALFFVSLVLFMGVLKESAGLIVPYLMWVKMSASVGVVVVIFLATNYRLAQVGTQLTLHMLLMVAHAMCFHVVHEYDTQGTNESPPFSPFGSHSFHLFYTETIRSRASLDCL
ncbi:hypothetical protein FHG87_005487 [Trinorchestia longiramus]|nr:hypothetical protein FHG87_005487 [Trinorchestia longiramus]